MTEKAEGPVEESAPVEIVGVGFRTAGKTYYFSPKSFQLTVGTPVIVETARGVEMGKITIANRMVSSSEIVAPLREIIRPATAADISRHEENRRLEERAAEICKQKIKSHKLDMDLVSVEYTFDNSKLLFYFTAENRVDFRELVKDLASVFKTRIELRQIGIRDEAKLMGGFGVCGRPFCCSSFLSDFVQVSIKMAKEQNFSLNSAKISGACGRLMCCLRYEHDVYEEAIKLTPSVGSYVSTANGLGVVTETRPLAGTVKVRLDEKTEAPRLYAVSDIKVIRSKGKSGLQPEDDAVELTAENTVSEEENVSVIGNDTADEKSEKSTQNRDGGRPGHNRPRQPRKKERRDGNQNPAEGGENRGRNNQQQRNKNDHRPPRPRRDGKRDGNDDKKQEGKPTGE
ncbi:MAG: hypothetical protein IJY20_02845 [Clostridia bacterium]|nr:hypothetical protein [Clostridia bacterium]